MITGSSLQLKDAARPRFSLPTVPTELTLTPTSDLRPCMTLDDAPIESMPGRWSVANVKWREEKAFAEHLTTLRVPYFLPLKRCRDRWRNVVWLALFPSYVFFAGGSDEYYAVLDSGLCISNDPVKAVLSCARQRQLRDDLSRIHQQQLLKPEIVTSYKPGTPVKVKAGPWMGREGFIESDTGKAYVIFRSEIFGDSSTPFEIDRDHVELMDA